MVVVTRDNVESIVTKAVDDVKVIDLHTHLFPASHGALHLAGVDELLTYHYLIAEYFMVAPMSMTPEIFYDLSKREQADLIWDALFIQRTPISEACQGVITTLTELGYADEVKARSLTKIRKDHENMDPSEYTKKIFELSKVEYAIMTNIPFDHQEAEQWKNKKPVPKEFKSALRIDDLIFNWEKAKSVIESEGFSSDNEGVRKFLLVWIDRISPEYFMASFPSSFTYPAESAHSTRILDEVILPLAVEMNLPFALKCGTRRGVNPALRTAGDAVGVAEVAVIERLCVRWPQCKFLVTFLSRVNQHELNVICRKFRNLHQYGCWWFLNTPSHIDEMTRARLELLGSAFTSQHSDCRILDQLVYKWKHSRRVIGRVLVEKFRDLIGAGWSTMTEEEVKKTVHDLFRGSYEEFMSK